MAILLEVKAPEGRRWQAVTAGEGAEGITVTHGEMGEERVKILLDGILGEDSDSPLIWLWVDSPFDQGERVAVTGEGGGELLLHILRDGGRIETLPLSVEWEEAIGEPDETTGTPEATETPETTDAPQFVETAEKGEEVLSPPGEESPPSESASTPTATFLGCRETGVGEGMFAVQFLFGGAGVGTPVLCMEGGGLLYVSCGTIAGLFGVQGQEASRFCTMQGLLADRRYVFWVGTEDGWVIVTYEGGIFCGFVA